MTWIWSIPDSRLSAARIEWMGYRMNSATYPNLMYLLNHIFNMKPTNFVDDLENFPRLELK
jgi:hypothetical protein